MSFIGLIPVALGHLFFGIVCIAYLFLPGPSIRWRSTRPISSRVTDYAASGLINARGPVGNRQWNARPASRSTVAAVEPTAIAIHCGPK